jgi:hypothetical protein
MKKKDKIFEIVPKDGVQFKRFIAGKKQIVFDGEPPFKVNRKDFRCIKDWFVKTKKGGKEWKEMSV